MDSWVHRWMMDGCMLIYMDTWVDEWMDDGKVKAGGLAWTQGWRLGQKDKDRDITDLLKSLVALPQLLLQVGRGSLQLLPQLPQPKALQHPWQLGPVPGQDPPVGMDRLQPAIPPSHPAVGRPTPMPTCCG